MTINEKKKKRNSDKELPWTGLNWGQDKGAGAVARFNHFNGTDGFSSSGGSGGGDGAVACGGMGENLELDETVELGEAKNIRSNYLIVRMAFAGRRINQLKNSKIINTLTPEEIVDGNILDRNVKLVPSTNELMWRTDDHSGSGDEIAKNTGTIVHQVFALTGNKDLDEIKVRINLQDHTSLHNKVFSNVQKKLCEDSDIKADIERYKEAYQKLINIDTSSISDYQEMEINLRKQLLDAWIIRQIGIHSFEDNKFDYYYQQELSKELGNYIISHPEIILPYLNNNKQDVITIKGDKGDYKVIIILNTISDEQRRTLNRFINGNTLKYFPEILDNDFILCKIIEGPDKVGQVITEPDELRTLFKKEESLREDLNFEKIKTLDLRKYIETNLYNKKGISLYSSDADKDSSLYHDELLNTIIGRIPRDEFRLETDTSSYLSDSDIRGRLWNNKKFDLLKQKVIADYVRQLFEVGRLSDIILFSKDGPQYRDNGSVYFKVGDLKIAFKKEPEKYYQIDLPRDSIIEPENIYKYIESKKLVALDVVDNHFKDSSGNTVPGIKFEFDRNGRISNILTLDSCDVNSIHTIVFDIPIKYVQTGRYSSYEPSLGSIITSKKINNLNTVIIRGNVLNSGCLISLNCKNLIFENYTDFRLPSRCLAYLKGCDKVDLPKSLKYLDEECFYHSDLKEIFIPMSITSLGKGCFEGCNDLTVRFEVPKDQVKTPSRYKSQTYDGYFNKWGKSSVAKILWDQTDESIGESLTEDNNDDEVLFDDRPNYEKAKDLDGTNVLFENNEWVVLTTPDIKKLAKIYTENYDNYYVSSEGSYYCLSKVSNEYCYFFNLIHYNYSYLFSNKFYRSPESQVFGFLRKNEVLYKFFVFDYDTKGFENIKSILNQLKITKDTPLNDKLYFRKVDLNLLKDANNKNDVVNIIMNALNTEDYETVLDFYNLPYPRLEDFKEQVSKILDSDIGRDILSRYNIDSYSLHKKDSLYHIIENSLLNSLFSDMKEQVVDIVKNKLSELGNFKINVNSNSALVYVLDIFNYVISKQDLKTLINLRILDLFAKSFVEENLNLVKGGSSYTSYSNSVNLLSQDNKPKLDKINKTKFLKELESNLEYYE